LQSIAESQKASAARADARMEKSAARMDRAETRMDHFELRMERSEARFNKRMDAIGKLIQTGMKLIARSEVRHEKMDLKMGEVTEKLDALIAVVDGVVKRPGSNPR
jgi:predicted transcriptional regulator